MGDEGHHGGVLQTNPLLRKTPRQVGSRDKGGNKKNRTPGGNATPLERRGELDYSIETNGRRGPQKPPILLHEK